ncbi:hypothetical protein D3C86_1641260 [compost metagenome]
MGRKFNGTSVIRAFRFDNVHHLGDHITRATNNDFIANPQAQTCNFISVMQSRIADQYTRDLNRFQTCDRGNRPGTAYLKFHVAHEGHLFLGGEFKRHRPTRCTRHKT